MPLLSYKIIKTEAKKRQIYAFFSFFFFSSTDIYDQRNDIKEEKNDKMHLTICFFSFELKYKRSADEQKMHA